MGTGRAGPRERLVMATLRLAMVAGLALVAVAGSVGLTPGQVGVRRSGAGVTPA
jgi:hypothetical protein